MPLYPDQSWHKPVRLYLHIYVYILKSIPLFKYSTKKQLKKTIDTPSGLAYIRRTVETMKAAATREVLCTHANIVL